jgi:hypothetical protein
MLEVSFCRQASSVLGGPPSNEQTLRFLEDRITSLGLLVGAGLSVDFGLPTWPHLLREVARKGQMEREIAALVDERRFEEAAELIENRHPGLLAEFLGAVGSPSRLPTVAFSRAAVRHLPRLTRSIVLTTNFDAVLEQTFARAGKPFDAVYSGTQVRHAARAVQENRHVLLKLHGDYASARDRVLTLSEYRKHYAGFDTALTVDLSKELPSLLSQALGARPILFLGCSLLPADRMTQVITAVIERLPGLTHYALLSDREQSAERLEQLRGWNIWPIFFKDAEFQRIDAFLAVVAERVELSGRPQRLWKPFAQIWGLLALGGAVAWPLLDSVADASPWAAVVRLAVVAFVGCALIGCLVFVRHITPRQSGLFIGTWCANLLVGHMIAFRQTDARVAALIVSHAVVAALLAYILAHWLSRSPSKSDV